MPEVPPAAVSGGSRRWAVSEPCGAVSSYSTVLANDAGNRSPAEEGVWLRFSIHLEVASERRSRTGQDFAECGVRSPEIDERCMRNWFTRCSSTLK